MLIICTDLLSRGRLTYHDAAPLNSLLGCCIKKALGATHEYDDIVAVLWRLVLVHFYFHLWRNTVSRVVPQKYILFDGKATERNGRTYDDPVNTVSVVKLWLGATICLLVAAAYPRIRRSRVPNRISSLTPGEYAHDFWIGTRPQLVALRSVVGARFATR